MYWLTENSFPIVMIGILFVGASFGFGFILQQRKLFWAGCVSLLITIALVTTEQLVVTDNEQIQSQIYQMARCVRRNDVEGLLEYTSAVPGKEGARRRVQSEMPNYHFQGCQVRALTIEFDEFGGGATAYFTVWVNVDTNLIGDRVGTGAEKVILKFEKESDGVWRVVHLDHMPAMSGVRL